MKIILTVAGLIVMYWTFAPVFTAMREASDNLIQILGGF